mmetsp:Transcript_95461/g.183408  ORF Transcript_95461/g.183408 Transcript_95461/m.183408 type:complete len:215 (-) Transcript_95461:150-794(-)
MGAACSKRNPQQSTQTIGESPPAASEDLESSLQDSGMTPLHIAARNGDMITLNKLMNAEDIDDDDAENLVNAQDKLGRTPLHYAAMMGEATTGSALVEFGADPAIGDKDGNTPLHLTAIYGKQLVTSMLCWAMSASCCDVHVSNDHGNTALHEAAIHNHVNVAWQVMEKCDVDMKTIANSDGKLPIDLAREAKADKVVFLLENGQIPDDPRVES